MRNAVISGDYVVTVDNAVAIGEKPLDAVYAPYHVVSAFTMRVMLLEQLCANAKVAVVTVGNGAGPDGYDGYLAGIHEVFRSIQQPLPQMAVSTETNMATQQSALSITAIGKRQAPREQGAYRYIIGAPHVGQGVLENPQDIAPLRDIYALWEQGIITHVWPTGSKGIAAECERFFGDIPNVPLQMTTTCGPSTVVLAYATQPLHLTVPHFSV